MVEKNNQTIAFNVLYVKMNLYHVYILKRDLNPAKENILLMILIRERWHFLVVKNSSALLRGTISWLII